ncbi:MAG: CHAT domain-containing protein, partial [Cyanobacteria bacterium J06639_18]
LTKAMKQAKELGDARSISYTLGNIARVYEYNKQWEIASEYTESALSFAQSINASDIKYQWEWQLGRILLKQGDSQGAIQAYTLAIESLQSLRSDLIALNLDTQFDFRDEVEPVYRQLVSLLLQPSNTSSKDVGSVKEISQKNLKQARNVIEALQLAQIDNFFQDACSIAEPKRIDQIVDNGKIPTAVIYPIILPDRIEIIVKLSGVKELRHYTTNKPQTEVEYTLNILRRKLQQRYTFRDREQISQEVYNWLIEPIEKDLQKNQIKNLVFVLDGLLRNIPMAALYDGKQYLMEKYSLALAPGLQLVAPSQEDKKLKALTGGITEPHQGFRALPHVAKELEKIQSKIPSKKLLNNSFTNKTIGKQVTSVSYPIFHLATHGKFSSQVENTFILTWDGKIDARELKEVLQSREESQGKRFRKLNPIELLVLSACETATGDKRAALGLAGIAVRSGARSTIASLWRVDDESTSVLMAEFYRQLGENPNISKAEALSAAQRLVFQKRRKHPYFWAPYVLVGNWF